MRDKISSKGLSVNTQGRFPGIYLGIDGKESACSVGDWGSIPGSGRSFGVGSGNSLQYSCLENSMDRGTWWDTVHEVAKELDTTEHTHSV